MSVPTARLPKQNHFGSNRAVTPRACQPNCEPASCDFEPYLCHHHHGDWKSATLIVLPRDAISAAAVLANQLGRIAKSTRHTAWKEYRRPSRRSGRSVRARPAARAYRRVIFLNCAACGAPSISDRSGRLTHRLPPKPKRRMLTTPDPSGQHQFIMQREETQHEQA